MVYDEIIKELEADRDIYARLTRRIDSAIIELKLAQGLFPDGAE